MTTTDLDTAIAEKVVGWEPATPLGTFSPTTSHDDFMLAWEKLDEGQRYRAAQQIERVCGKMEKYHHGLVRWDYIVGALDLALPDKCRAMLEAVG